MKRLFLRLKVAGSQTAIEKQTLAYFGQELEH